MSTPQNPPPYQPPYQPQYQAAPPYGYSRPRPTHTGKLVGAIILFIAGVFLGLLIAGIGSLVVVVNIATSGDTITNGQQVTASSGDERTVYVPEDRSAGVCSVTTSDGETVPTSFSIGSHLTINDDSYDSAVKFKATKSGEYRVSCSGLSDSDSVLVAPPIKFGPFLWPLVAGLCVGALCWIIAVVLLVRRHRALAAQAQAG